MSEKAIKQELTAVRELTLNGLLVAVVFLATYYIQIKLPISINGGLIHMGNTALFTIALVLGKRRGAIAGAFGMGLFDILSGWGAWAPFTFVIRGIMGYMIGSVSDYRGSQGRKLSLNLMGIIVASIWMIIGYYGAEGIMYGNWTAPMSSIPGNLIQLLIGTLVALPLSKALQRFYTSFGRR